MTGEIPEFGDEDFSEFLAKKQQRRQSSVSDKRSAEAKSMRVEDGRIKSTTNDRGLAQLNVRVPLDLKNQVIDEKRTTGREMGDVVADALLAYFKNKRNA